MCGKYVLCLGGDGPRPDSWLLIWRRSFDSVVGIHRLPQRGAFAHINVA